MRIGDSDFGPAMIAGGSMGTRSWSWAVKTAAGELRERLALGADIPAEGLTVRADTTEALGALAPAERHSFGAQFAEVAVDVTTGEVRVRRMLGIFAAGRIVNPLTARNQFLGGMIWGISMALHEEAVRDRASGGPRRRGPRGLPRRHPRRRPPHRGRLDRRHGPGRPGRDQGHRRDRRRRRRGRRRQRGLARDRRTPPQPAHPAGPRPVGRRGSAGCLTWPRNCTGWTEEGREFAVATVVAVGGSAPRGPGAALAVDGAGTAVGSVSGGCVEGAVYDLCQEALRTGESVLERFGYSDEDAFAVGLTCGGTIDVLITPVPAGAPARTVLGPALSAAARGEPAALARVARGPRRTPRPGPAGPARRHVRGRARRSPGPGPDGGAEARALLERAAPARWICRRTARTAPAE